MLIYNAIFYRLWGEPVNLREQHDALEFFNSLVDSLEEALKLLNQPCILSQILSGSFADQKICKDCPHRSATFYFFYFFPHTFSSRFSNTFISCKEM